MTPDDDPQQGLYEMPDRLPGWMMIPLGLFALVLALILGYHATASYRAFVARDASLPIDTRVQTAASAVSMEPWNTNFQAVYGYAVSQRSFAHARYREAVDVMAKAYKGAPGDEDMLAYFKRIQAVLAVDTNRKAHLQHGHEGPGGTLNPSDIER